MQFAWLVSLVVSAWRIDFVSFEKRIFSSMNHVIGSRAFSRFHPFVHLLRPAILSCEYILACRRRRIHDTSVSGDTDHLSICAAMAGLQSNAQRIYSKKYVELCWLFFEPWFTVKISLHRYRWLSSHGTALTASFRGDIFSAFPLLLIARCMAFVESTMYTSQDPQNERRSISWDKPTVDSSKHCF